MMRLLTALLAALLCASMTAQAHHSIAMFDNSKVVTLEGTVYKFEWTNPHVWLWMTVAGEDGVTQTWGFESGAPVQLKRGGLAWDSFKAGDKISITFHPAKSGETGGQLLAAILADGTKYRTKDPSLQAAFGDSKAQ